MNRLRRLRDDRGASAVEFALVAPLLVMAIGMVVTMGMYAFYAGVAEHAAREAAHAATLRVTRSPTAGYPATSAIAAVAKAESPSYAATPVVSVVSAPLTGAPGGGDVVTVTVTYDVGFISGIGRLLPFVTDDLGVITRTAQARRE